MTCGVVGLDSIVYAVLAETLLKTAELVHLSIGILLPDNFPTLKVWRKSAQLIFFVFSALTTGMDISQLKIESTTDGGAVLVEQLRIVHTPVKHDLGRRGGLDDVKDRTEGVLGETKDVNEICIWDFRSDCTEIDERE